MLLLLQVAVFLLAAALLALTLASVVQFLVLPRSARNIIVGGLFMALLRCFKLALRFARTYHRRDAVMAYFAPVALLLLVPIWLALVLVAFAGFFWATGMTNWYEAFALSGSSLFTLGFKVDDTALHMVLAFAEAGIGMMIVALLIGYLPTMYSAFSAREAAVNQLDVRAGTPPSVAEMVTRAHQIGKLGDMTAFWREWELLFTQLAESHTTLPALVFFRSPTSDRSWVTATGNVLDCAAFIRATVAVRRDPQADLCIRAGYLALRRIADYFGIDYPGDPSFPADPISIDRSEFDAVCDELAAAGVPLVAERDQAWMDFAGWRVNYDRVLIGICALTMAPYAPWSSDRSPRAGLPKHLHWGMTSNE